MQWFINIITSLFTNRHRYYDRGDSAFDFQIGDFVLDNLWHDLDLSGIIPVNAVAVHIYFNMRAVAVNEIVMLRAKDYVLFGSFHQLHTPVAHIRVDCPSVIVALNPGRIIEYKVKSGNVTILDLAVRGWWME